MTVWQEILVGSGLVLFGWLLSLVFPTESIRRKLGLEPKPPPPHHFTRDRVLDALLRDPIVAPVLPEHPEGRLQWQRMELVPTALAHGWAVLRTKEGAEIHHRGVQVAGVVQEDVLMVRSEVVLPPAPPAEQRPRRPSWLWGYGDPPKDWIGRGRDD